MTHKGYRQTPEHRAKIAAAKRRQYEDPIEREKTRHKSTTHGQVGTGAYTSWYAMKRRAQKTQPVDARYYQGMDMDPRWSGFAAFYADMGDRPIGHTIDRIDRARGYWPDNCRWATAREQRLNQSRPMRMADCHPDRKHCANGLCRPCWRRNYRAAHGQ